MCTILHDSAKNLLSFLLSTSQPTTPRRQEEQTINLASESFLRFNCSLTRLAFLILSGLAGGGSVTVGGCAGCGGSGGRAGADGGGSGAGVGSGFCR